LEALFLRRGQTEISRIQFALAGMNAHINHDLPLAIVANCKARNSVPRHGTPQYDDYTALNATLDSLIDMAKKNLNVRLLGDPLPAVSHLEDLFASWDPRGLPRRSMEACREYLAGFHACRDQS
jgi:hypothetical protein